MDAPKIERGNTKLALKAGFWYVMSAVLTKGISFLTTPIFARLMSKSDYGEFSNFANWQSILLIVVGIELYNTLSRAYYDFRDDYDQYVSTVTIGSCVFTLIFFFLFWLCRGFIYRVVSIPPQYTLVLFCILMMQSCKSIYFTRERTMYRYKSVAIITMLCTVIPTLIAVALVIFLPEAQRLSGRIYGFYIPYALFGVYCAVVMIRAGKCFKWSYFKYALVLAIPLMTHYLTTYLLTSTNVILTKSILDAEKAAIVSVTVSVMNILTVVFQAVTGALTTWMMDNLEQGKHDLVRKCSFIYAGAVAVISMGVMLLGPEVIWVLGGRKYAQAVTLIPGLSYSIFFQTVTTLLTIILTFDKNVVKTAIFTSAAAVLSIVARILLLPKFDYACLPLVSVVTLAILFVVNYILVRKAGYGDCIHMKMILVVAAVVGVCTLACDLLYAHTMIRYAVVLAMGVAALIVLYRTREVWLKILKKKKSNTES